MRAWVATHRTHFSKYHFHRVFPTQASLSPLVVHWWFTGGTRVVQFEWTTSA